MNILGGGTGDRHPMEQLGLALDRASSILSTLTACYDSDKNRFLVSEDYVVQAIASIENFVGDAKFSHSLLSNTSFVPLENRTQATPFVEAFLANNTAETTMQVQGFAEEPTPPPAPLVEPAATYEELLRKVTAAEVFAAEGQSNEQGNANAALLPLLKSLKHDLRRYRAA